MKIAGIAGIAAIAWTGRDWIMLHLDEIALLVLCTSVAYWFGYIVDKRRGDEG